MDQGETVKSICDQEAITLGLCTERNLGRYLIKEKDGSGNPIKFVQKAFNDYIEREGDGGKGYTALEKIESYRENPALTNEGFASELVVPRTKMVLFSDLRENLIDGIANITWVGAQEVIVTYQVNATGYYCVDTLGSGEFIGRADWISGYGSLPASEYIKIGFYQAMAVIYAVILIAWIWMSVKVRKDLLPLQSYIGSLIGVMLVNMLLSAYYWRGYNAYGSASQALAILMVVFSAARNSLAFFLLLVVCLGYGIVRPTLGSTMNQCLILLGLHFIAGCVYGLVNTDRDDSEIDDDSLFVVLPIMIFTMIFYVWSMHSVVATTRILETRRQSYKLSMYNKMWNLLFYSIIALFAFFAVNIANVAMMGDTNWTEKSWRFRWMLFDGWLNIHFLVVFCIFLWMWRPTENNHRYGIEQLMGDEGDAWERGPSHDGHAMMLADERDFQLALEEADRVADSFVLQEQSSRLSSSYRNVNQPDSQATARFVLDDDDNLSDDDHDLNLDKTGEPKDSLDSSIDNFEISHKEPGNLDDVKKP
ncbi:hypothetical protein AX774_g3651 [Zancudomyces culisetae]|uniref:GOST seven transmembrane domain-containing protein n=1 Tax=Zancudomyces culisetae TaxID=1213189 RepID=A0A1R1PPE1_ZANCU|nr:hypothetical protein AX774_g3651 [Zancudomyces culisetae]|eukprot:OMH82856.1 hypothetical protein AX774_g3651 [Zancudomyces culisetae]